MTSVDATGEAAANGDRASELDALDEFSEKLDAFKAFSSNDREAADELFESLGGRGKVEQEMLLQLGAWLPLYKPDRFEQSHRVVMRALEVLYRNLRRAWFQVEKVVPGYGGSALGIPTFLIGGAFASSLTGVVSNLGDAGGGNKILLTVVAIVLYALLVVLAIVFFTS